MGDLKCGQCDKLFSTQNILDRHCSIEHPVGDTFKCLECDKELTNKESFAEHIKQHPLANVIHSCKQCNKEFTRRYHLERHISQKGCCGIQKPEFKCQVLKQYILLRNNV